MKLKIFKLLNFIFIIVFLFLYALPFMLYPSKDYAIYNPTTVPNNKVGAHILFPTEIDAAANLVNSNGGDWGYVTIPIAITDLNLQKWQTFMDKAKQDHIIPILRLATDDDYFSTVNWNKPKDLDILEFANFLDSLSWPTKNRYVVIFNEPNRNDEWGGQLDSGEYAQILSYAVTVFKSKNSDFFIISAGMDNAAANSSTSENEYNYLYDMNQAVPGIFNQIDGLGSHSYPNPAFSGAPNDTSYESIDSFSHEENEISQFTNKKLPVFITETGWDQSKLPSSVVSQYFPYAFKNVWNDSNVIAVTPFLLEAGAPFSQFSILTSTGGTTDISQAITAITKTKGQPQLNPDVLSASIENPKSLPIIKFKATSVDNLSKYLSVTKQIAKYLLHI